MCFIPLQGGYGKVSVWDLISKWSQESCKRAAGSQQKCFGFPENQLSVNSVKLKWSGILRVMSRCSRPIPTVPSLTDRIEAYFRLYNITGINLAFLFFVLQVMSHRPWAQWRVTTQWSGAGSMWPPCPLHDALLLCCRRPASSLWLEELPRDPVTLWKPSAYRKQCDAGTKNPEINANRHQYFLHSRTCRSWIALRCFLTLIGNNGFHLHTGMSTTCFGIEEVFSEPDREADCCDWQRQETESFYTPGKSEREKNEPNNKLTRTRFLKKQPGFELLSIFSE